MEPVAHPKGDEDHNIVATWWPHGSLHLSRSAVTFRPTNPAISPETWPLSDILNLACDPVTGTLTLLEGTRLDTRPCGGSGSGGSGSGGSSSTDPPPAQLPPKSRAVRLATTHVFVTSSGAGDGRMKSRSWVSDAKVDACRGCTKIFDLFRRKNHCRMCGDVFCAACCHKKHPSSAINLTREYQRVAAAPTLAEKACFPCSDAFERWNRWISAASSKGGEEEAKAEEPIGPLAADPAAAAAPFAAATQRALVAASSGEALRSVLVLINPFSGRRMAKQVRLEPSPLLKAS